MSRNRSFLWRVARWAMLPLTACVFSGCASNDRSSIGRLQVGDAGGVCSFLTTTLVGPNVGRGRNEGHLKSSGEIRSLFGPFGVKARFEAWRLAAIGVGLEEYNGITFASSILSLNEDTLFTAEIVRDRQLVPSEDQQVFYRRLFSGYFLNTDVLIESLEHGDIGVGKVREQLWRWLGYTYHDYRLDYYLFAGNRNMARKLFTRGVITRGEAEYLLARWFLERTAYETSMLEDLEYFEIISAEDSKDMTKLELGYFSHFNISSAERETLIKRHAALYDAVRAKALWPLTIPRQSRVEAVAPSLRNRYADRYDPREFIELEDLVIPKPFIKYVGYDPRIAVGINDGRRLSTSEKLSRWSLGNIFSAFGAGGGRHKRRM